jgi:hypothetical protein
MSEQDYVENLRRVASKLGLENREELNLLLAVFDPKGYRRGLAEKLRRRGVGIVARERRPNNPYKPEAA